MTVALHRKERIVFTAIDVINELGVQALSTKRIAAYENIAESTVFKHFGSKNDILLEVLQFYQKFDAQLYESIRIKPLKGLEGISYLFENYLKYYENYPALTAITQGIDEMRYSEDLCTLVDAIGLYRLEQMQQLVQESQASGEIHKEFDASVVAELLWTCLNGSVRSWRNQKFSFELHKRGMQYLNYLLKGIVVRDL